MAHRTLEKLYFSQNCGRFAGADIQILSQFSLDMNSDASNPGSGQNPSPSTEWETPLSWRAKPDQRTPDGSPAIYRSNVHALMGLRLRYMAEVLEETENKLEAAEARYQAAWERFLQHGKDMQGIVAAVERQDIDSAAKAWNEIDQVEVDKAFRIILGERETVPGKGKSLATLACNYFGITSSGDKSIPKNERDRPLRPSDNNAAWDRATDGRCNGCGAPTISHSQRLLLHREMKAHPNKFDLTPTYSQHNGVIAPLWPQVTIAAKGVAEHVEAWSTGGLTDPSNLTNCCSGCNYARNDTSMDALGSAAYDRPRSEIDWRADE